SAEKRREITESIFREAHSLKGAARAVGASQVEVICQSLESIFALLKRSDAVPSSNVFDVLQRSVDLVRESVAVPDAAAIPGLSESVELLRGIKDNLSVTKPTSRTADKAVADEPPRDAEAAPARIVTQPPTSSGNPGLAGDEVRISVDKLNSLYLHIEELLSVKLGLEQRREALQELSGRSDKQLRNFLRGQSRTGVRKGWRDGAVPGGSTISKVHGDVPLPAIQEEMRALAKDLSAAAEGATADSIATSRLIDALLEEARSILMQPFSSILESFPRMVRDLCRGEGKEASLVVEGAETEVDRRILVQLKDPLIHLLRNAVHYGIETSETRRAGGKNPSGTISLKISQVDNNRAELTVADDGAGMDIEGIKKAALSRGVISEAQTGELSEEEVMRLAFHSEITTSRIITEIAGRGLGLSIVQEKIDVLGGAMSVTTKEGAGSTFTASFPLSLSTFRGIVVRAGARLFVVPAAQTKKVLTIAPGQIKTIQGQPAISFADNSLYLYDLCDLLGLEPAPPSRKEDLPVLVLFSGTENLAVRVSEVMYEHEVVVKSLGPQLFRVRNILGASVLGSGALVPVLNVADLVLSATSESQREKRPSDADKKPSFAAQTILVAEDSITSRTLLRNILESRGYIVVTAVDGREALTALKQRTFDLLVSDVDMPRMNGFELTAAVRRDEKLAELPVVLVTSLESREDREKGIESGANAYIVKSSFDQSNLLEIAERLL
ncbi:MAG TPA: response regulator, partial [Spirochaetia bacterium]|nr:response regulator [Spirochaetia bacterium]